VGKIDLQPKVNMGQARMYKFISESRPGLYHYVMIFDNGNGTQCSCEGWQHQKHCWHVVEATRT